MSIQSSSYVPTLDFPRQQIENSTAQVKGHLSQYNP
nr:MAG TPA: hypothetical protein [Inoviridae sp.]